MRFLAKVFLVFILLFSFFEKSALAENEFLVDSKVEYKVEDSGKTLVTHDITLENAFSTLYATSYTLSLENIEAKNIKATTFDGRELLTENLTDGDKTNIKINFNDIVVGRGNKRHFLVTYENTNFAIRTGEIWEISIPRLSKDSSFKSYLVTLRVPIKFGLEAYISPRPEGSKEEVGEQVYTFSKDELLKTGVTAGFGEFQVFTYTLNYHLENPLGRGSETQIAIPPDTAFQKVYIRSISPEPSGISIDGDGNWLATYKLSSRQRLDVKVSGEVQIFSSNRAYPIPTEEILSQNLKETPFWQVNDPEIKSLAGGLKTPRAIYDYVSTTLKYDYERVRPNVERLGAKGALKTPSTAICMEFTDLFIALARAAGIPAREINGYAYTENPDIQPLSLVADVLHAWPEYWDSDRHSWIPVDPTWASTTGGVNFFDKLDLRHFTFVIHGMDASKPYAPGSYKLGPNPQKDVFVSFGKLTSREATYPEVSATFKQGLPFLGSNLNIKIKNPGPSAFYSLYPEVYFDQKKYLRNFIEILTPYETFEFNVKVPYSFLGKDTPTTVKISAGGSEVTIPTNKNRVVISSLVGIFILLIILLLIILIRMGRISFAKITPWTKLLLKKFPRLPESTFSKQVKPPSTSEKL